MQLSRQCKQEAKQLHKVMGLFAEMQLKGLKPSAVTYSTTVSAG